MTYAFETVLVDVDQGVATLTLNRPDAMNAFDPTMDREFHEAMWLLDADEDVRVIVVTGAGRAFCSGIDLAGGADVFGAEAHEAHDAAQGVDSDSVPERSAFWRMRTPVIGAINGAAVGAGLTVPMLFDLRIVAADAKLGFVFTRRGIVPDANICWLLPRLVGVERALELLVTGRMFSGEEAAAMGLALRAVPKEAVLAEAQALAREIATWSAPAASGIVKQLVYEFLGETDRQAAFARETKVIWWAGEQPDAMEGVMSFLEKREPVWTTSKHAELPAELQ
ncbi:MAG TPA: enoyl-CoA hydratase-related protein [Acidimicrobiales bacterium]|nr:enoyl-CoA hydratase-related protein [Acidimicrobiales bacterium]